MWYMVCVVCLHYVPGEGCTNHMIDSLMFKEQGSEKSCFCPSEANHLPSDKHPCTWEGTWQACRVARGTDTENVGPLTFGDEATLIEARVRMRSATKWARIVDFGNGAQGSVVLPEKAVEEAGL